MKKEKKIFEVHLKKRLRGLEVTKDISIDNLFIERLSMLTDGFVGAEIEQSVISALYEAFFNQRNIKEQDFFNAIQSTVPLSVTQKEQIVKLREWANVRAVSATARSDMKSLNVNSADNAPARPEKPEKPEPTPDDNSFNFNRGGRLLDF